MKSQEKAAERAWLFASLAETEAYRVANSLGLEHPEAPVLALLARTWAAVAHQYPFLETAVADPPAPERDGCGHCSCGSGYSPEVCVGSSTHRPEPQVAGSDLHAPAPAEAVTETRLRVPLDLLAETRVDLGAQVLEQVAAGLDRLNDPPTLPCPYCTATSQDMLRHLLDYHPERVDQTLADRWSSACECLLHVTGERHTFGAPGCRHEPR